MKACRKPYFPPFHFEMLLRCKLSSFIVKLLNQQIIKLLNSGAAVCKRFERYFYPGPWGVLTHQWDLPQAAAAFLS